MSESFYLVLPSNSCPLTQPDNVASQFRVDYHNPIKLDGAWEAALTEFSYNYSPITVGRGAYIKWTEVEYFDRDEEVEITCTKSVVNDKVRYKFVVNPPHFKIKWRKFNKDSKNEDILIKITSHHKQYEIVASNAIKEKYGLIFNPSLKSNDRGEISSYSEANSTRIVGTNKIHLYWKEEEIRDIRYDFEEDISTNDVNELLSHISYKIGRALVNNVVINKDGYVYMEFKEHVKKMELDIRLAYVLGFQSNFTTMGTWTATNRPKTDTDFNHMYIYTSLTEPIRVGGVIVPLLKSIWIDKSRKIGDVVHVNLENPMYIRVANSSINNIEVNIRDDSGRVIGFSRDSKTNLTIHLRKRNE